MTLYEFRSLNELEQASAVWDGKHLGNRTEEDMQVLLYSVGEFYAEVFYRPDDNKIVYIKSFKTNRLLVPYIMIN